MRTESVSERELHNHSIHQNSQNGTRIKTCRKSVIFANMDHNKEELLGVQVVCVLFCAGRKKVDKELESERVVVLFLSRMPPLTPPVAHSFS